MIRHALALLLLLCGSSLAYAQLSQEARFKILAEIIAIEGAARLPMPLGGEGLELSDTGEVNRQKLQKEIEKNGSVVTAGKIVSITALEFKDKSIEIELDGGGTKKKSFLSRIQIGVGGIGTAQAPQTEEQAKGSKITIQFASRVPQDLDPDRLKELLNAVIDFSKQSVAGAGVDALPPEFKQAVLEKRAMVGMDRNTVLLALGGPNDRIRERSSDGVMLEDWKYDGRGDRVTFVTFDFENDVVVSIREY